MSLESKTDVNWESHIGQNLESELPSSDLDLINTLSSSLATTLKNLPSKPGVYRYFDASGQILYVGKAKNLKKRVSSYFQQGRVHNQRLALLISQINRIDYTEVSSEKEALILEANLIHNLQPRYNIKLKDDSNYIYIRITNDVIPGIFLTRRKYDPNSRYFGPYTKRAGVFSTLHTLRTLFPYCQQKVPQSRPCSYTQIKQCDGICAGLENKSDYLKKIEQIALVLQGKTKQVEEYVLNKIEQACLKENYQLAALWRDRLKTLKDTISDQKVILPQPQDLDIITLIIGKAENGLQVASVLVQTLRGGKMINLSNFVLVGTQDKTYTDTDETATTPNLFLDDDDISPSQNWPNSSLAFDYLVKFMNSYYSFNPDKAPVLVQCYQKVEED